MNPEGANPVNPFEGLTDQQRDEMRVRFAAVVATFRTALTDAGRALSTAFTAFAAALPKLPPGEGAK